MAGLPEFSQNVQVQANPSKSIANTTTSDTTSVAIGSYLSIKFFAPSGYVAKILNIYFDYPDPIGATSGTHSVYVRTGNAGLIGCLYAGQTFNQNITFGYGMFLTAVTTQYPADATAVALQSKGIMFDDTNFLEFVYYNETDVVTGATVKNVRLSYVLEKVA